MVKSQNCRVIIDNRTQYDMTYVRDWYDSGRVADSYSWPATIKSGKKEEVLNYEKDWSFAGCSGYVTYKMFGTEITIAFSNPIAGCNKLGVGTGGMSVWDDMDNHDYNRFTERIDSCDGKAIMQFDCKCTGETTNTCNVDVTAFTK